MNVDRRVRSGHCSRQRAIRSSVFSCAAGRAHAFEDFRRRVLERNVEIGQHFPFCHQRDDIVHVRIGIDIVQPHPNTQFT